VWAEVDRFYPRLDLVGLVPQTFTSHNRDAIAGFHAGVQWQWAQWVIGVEVAYSKGWRDISGTVSLSPSPPEPFATLGAYNKISNLLTAGPRLGYAWDRLLVFATGGYAVGPSMDNNTDPVGGSLIASLARPADEFAEMSGPIGVLSLLSFRLVVEGTLTPAKLGG
jgi:hypothetical protein